MYLNASQRAGLAGLQREVPFPLSTRQDVDAVFQRADENGFAEIALAINVAVALQRCRRIELHGGCEIFQNNTPILQSRGSFAIAAVEFQWLARTAVAFSITYLLNR